jgi:ATP-binding cassette subfamily B multidrug efflux pump
MFQRFYHWLEERVSSFPPEPPGQPPDRFWPFVWHYTRPFTGLIAAAVTLAVLYALAEIWLYGYMGRLVDILTAADRATLWQTHGNQFLWVGAIVLLVLPVLNFFAEAVSHQGLRGNYAMRIRWLSHRYVLRQSMDFFQNDYAGRVATKIMQGSLAVRDAVMTLSEVIVYVSVYVTGALVLVASADRWLMVPLILWLVGYATACWVFVPRMSKLSEKQADARSMVTGRVVDSYTNIQTVKLFASAGREEAFARDGMTTMLKAVYASMRLATSMIGTLGILSSLLIFSMSALSIWLWQQGQISTGAIAFAISLTLRFKAMSQWIIWEVAGLFENLGIIQDSLNTIARPIAVKDAAGAQPLTVTRGEICFDAVRFNYGKPLRDGRSEVIDGLTLTVKPGEKVGLVGRSGAGKSTLANLLLRFYDAAHGTITIDGQNIANVTQESLRAAIGVVTQDTSLLHRSVLDNLRYGKPDAAMAEVEAAAAKAHADGFIAGLADLNGRKAYDAHVGERGVKLSGGQRQRIAIARVLLKDAPILVLDEATSALDSEVEAAIQENLYQLMAGKTVIAVAHRLSTIAAMDRLVVMDKGRIVEMGRHADLVKKKNGLYASLWKRQSGGFLVEDIEPAKSAAE